MRIRFFVLTTCMAIAVAATLSSCGTTSQTVLAPGHVLINVTLSGPSSIAPGATAQMTGTAVYSDGVNTDLTKTGIGSWRSSNPDVVSISATGTASGLALGEARISVTVLSQTSSLTILVLPTGTFRLAGRVLESGLGVGGVKLEVTTGQGTGLSTLTDGSGGYRFYGVAGDVQVRASKDGYVTQTQPTSVAGNVTLNFELSLVNTPSDVTGTYLLSVSASGSCPVGSRGALPDDGRSRRYTAVVSQFGTTLRVALSGADFVLKAGAGNHFLGHNGPGITFHLNGSDAYYYYGLYYDLIEQLAPSRLLTIEGNVSVTLSGGNMTGILEGTIEVLTGVGRNPSAIGWCYSTDHQVVFTRQSPGPSAIRRLRQ